MRKSYSLPLLACAMLSLTAQNASPPKQAANHDLGYEDTPMLPGLPFRVHDPKRPHPRVVTPAAKPGGPPSDAIVLFDGKDLSKWKSVLLPGTTRATPNPSGVADWKLENGYFQSVPGTGDLATNEKFGDVQLHVEWATPSDPQGNSQSRGNSGVWLMSRYEVQVLDSYQNPTYADGQAGAIYGQWPPLVNPTRKPGEWQAYDIVFEAPRFSGGRLLHPATLTVFLNGILLHNRKELMGPTLHRQLAHYEPQPDADSIGLQNHNGRVRYRNIWIRRLGSYDEPER